jgi:hypothetical protein
MPLSDLQDLVEPTRIALVAGVTGVARSTIKRHTPRQPQNAACCVRQHRIEATQGATG